MEYFWISACNYYVMVTSQVIWRTSQTSSEHNQANNAVTQLGWLSKENKDALSNKLEEIQTQIEALRRRIGRATVAEPHSVDNNLAAQEKQLET